MNSNFNLTTYRPDKEYSINHFFVLNRGLNCGKPLDEPCPNCFVCECSSTEDKEALYWIFFALWHSQKFRYHLIGSVILYMRKKEIVNLVQETFITMQSKPDQFQNSLNLLKMLHEKELHFLDLVTSLKKAKREFARDLVK